MERKTVPDNWSSNTEASLAKLCPGSRDKHVTAMGRTEVCSTGGVDHCAADVFEVGWTSATDAVTCSSRNLELNPLGHWQPVEDNTQDWRDMFMLLALTTRRLAAFSAILSRRVTYTDTR